MLKSPFKSMQHACQTTTEMKYSEILLFRHERKVYYATKKLILFYFAIQIPMERWQREQDAAS